VELVDFDTGRSQRAARSDTGVISLYTDDAIEGPVDTKMSDIWDNRNIVAAQQTSFPAY